MDTYRLRQFCVIAETGSLTKAARLLHITHSGLSKAMKLLQEELNCLLLAPAGRGLTLTEDGMRIYQNAKEFLAQEERLFKREPLTTQKLLRIGAVEIFLLPLCEQLTRDAFNGSPVTLLNLNPGQIEQMIVNRELDYGLTYVPYPNADIEVTEVVKYQLGCYHLSGCFQGMDISSIPFVVPALGLSNNVLGIQERDGWIESLTPRNRKYSVNLLSTGLEMVLQGLCAIYIPKFIAGKINTDLGTQKKLVEFPIPKTQKNSQSIYLIKHKNKLENAHFKSLKKMIKSIGGNR